ncbi:hypothetical protein ACFWFX_10020 [Streptomyces roseolus]|uniref:hypothetical protein n=1 Tax=Streptomyces roseolus TaxID=67358 RepID=UPI003646FAF4
MPKPSFVIVTIEGPTYREGQTASTVPALVEIGATGTLDRFEEDGDYVDLFYSDGSKLSIPESRIAQIARRA